MKMPRRRRPTGRIRKGNHIILRQKRDLGDPLIDDEALLAAYSVGYRHGLHRARQAIERELSRLDDDRRRRIAERQTAGEKGGRR